ncbi:hypothetical protein B0A49_02626 [Cryomyces minteri]|uniref:Abscisic acid G-protein coupled receptor-like domain-containing protein n=1 Tax=Cryomyces minteri TaxID=331657 RepID=A0A4U0XLW5_9PEZI|nr:hypothetical protein B0A49_05391 [Cryomyces minteri]TKA78260.1 hypothetical protein B0A49_02626 [Cryomyces minteri]
MLPTAECDDCVPAYLQRRLASFSPSTIAFSSLPFILTFGIVALVVLRRLFPLVSGQTSYKDDQAQGLPTTRWNSKAPSSNSEAVKETTAKQIAAATFSVSIALSTVLVELLLCEISNSLNPAARGLALKITLSSLLILLILVTPAIEIQSVISASGFKFTNSTGRVRARFAWLLEACGLAAWLLAFWWLGRGLLGSYLHEASYERAHTFSEGCLERIGIIGISLMASLAGFAAVSSLWQTFGVRDVPVSEATIARSQSGLDATAEMLAAKQSRLRALQRKMSDVPQDSGFMSRAMSSIRGNADVTELNALRLEISGLETMRQGLANSLAQLLNRRAVQQRSRSTLGRFVNAFNYVFALYCLYRIGATSLTTLRRWWAPDTTFAGTDPINNVLALVAKHWDPSLDRLAWSRQISFALSGIMLLAAFNAVLQTSLLFARLFPTLLAHAQTNLALIVSQVAATYVIASALLLRSNLPAEVSSVITEALGAPLEPRFVDRWFEGWFLGAVAFTGVGIFLGRKIGGSGVWDEEDGGVEMGKRS